MNNEILHDVLLNLMYVLLVSVSTEVCSVGNYTNWGRVILNFSYHTSTKWNSFE